MLMMIPIRCIFSATVGLPCQLWSLPLLDLLLMLAEVRLGAFGGPLSVGMLSPFLLKKQWESCGMP